MTVASRLQETKDFLIANEWGQGAFKAYLDTDVRTGKPKYSYCLVGAVGATTTASGDSAYFDVIYALSRAIYDRDPYYNAPVSAWNDEPGRTKDEVLAVVDKAIALENESSVSSA